ncbi:leucine-rich repeat-containing protein C10orf11-like [Fopius arisanus]|uniref:Leucine-rich repeat-containing protein C10orf11-like n=1 Tax=Fopius arisanus TaxID=64838 RepID=A0A9R1TSE4_9HYME|nr:PREDICTED: leucine-rich repeat-containing protein C10orf11-like [Fopius arisanus]
MTSLGKAVFADINERHSSTSSENDSELISGDFDESSLSLAFENLFFMPYDIIERFNSSVSTLDISHNKFSRNLQFLTEFENLSSLNLDNNRIDAYTIFPYLPKLELLWLNHNHINQLFPFLRNLSESLPNLRYLCLMGNTSAPSYLNGGTFYDYLQYRLFVISWFPRLEHLDDRTVTPEQRREAKRLFKRPLFENLTENTPFHECITQIQNTVVSMFTKTSLHDRKGTQKVSNLVV